LALNQTVRPENYLWVIVEKRGGEESFLGLTSAGGQTFIPAAPERDQGLMLMGRLPAAEAGVTRELEAIHQNLLAKQAKEQGFAVYVVDDQGRILRELGQAAH
jgi:hypothetical protein